MTIMLQEDHGKATKIELSHSQKERELLQKMKKQLDDMKFNATPDKAADFLAVFEEFCKLKKIPKSQITIKLAKSRQSMR